MAKILCIQDVIMQSGDSKGTAAFTKDCAYNTYSYTLEEGWGRRTKVLCAKNNFGQRHIILKTEEDAEFFNTHFKEIKKGELTDAVPTL